MNNRIFIFLLGCIGFATTASAQYYYKEILSNKDLIADRNAYKAQKVRKVIVHSFESNGDASEGFSCEKNISKDYSRIETNAQTSTSSPSSLTTYFNDKGLLTKSSDNSDLVTAFSTYKYDENNNLINISSFSYSTDPTDTTLFLRDTDDTTKLLEEHKYFYNDAGQPTKMLKIKNGRDTIVVNFKIDEKGNVSDEIEAIPHGRHYYYYYSENNRLTDIVRYNMLRQKMMPDFMFEYNTDGQLLQMISIEEEVKNVYSVNNNYFTWKYFYADNGLRIIEKCYSKEKDLLGSVEYEYK